MFAIEEDLDKKLWLYAIHLGKDRSEVVNDLLRPIVASMVLYDSRDRRGGATPNRPSTAATPTARPRDSVRESQFRQGRGEKRKRRKGQGGSRKMFAP